MSSNFLSFLRFHRRHIPRSFQKSKTSVVHSLWLSIYEPVNPCHCETHKMNGAWTLSFSLRVYYGRGITVTLLPPISFLYFSAHFWILITLIDHFILKHLTPKIHDDSISEFIAPSNGKSELIKFELQMLSSCYNYPFSVTIPGFTVLRNMSNRCARVSLSIFDREKNSLDRERIFFPVKLFFPCQLFFSLSIIFFPVKFWIFFPVNFWWILQK